MGRNEERVKLLVVTAVALVNLSGRHCKVCIKRLVTPVM